MLLARSINFDTKTTIFDESLVTQLGPAFEVLPIVRRMMQPITEKETREMVALVQHDLPEIASDYARVHRELPWSSVDGWKRDRRRDDLRRCNEATMSRKSVVPR